jgi:phosphopantetheinyl transferase (holo-ACP synthase)
MISSGNDIVSLDAVNVTRTKQPRFYSKILSASEKELYQLPQFAIIPFENFVWLLWSVKEAAFKYLQRLQPGLVFSPTKFIVKELQLPLNFRISTFNTATAESAGFDVPDVLSGLIVCNDNTLYYRSLLYSNLVHSVVEDNDHFENTYWGMEQVESSAPADQSASVRVFLTARLKSLLNCAAISINKNDAGIPFIRADQTVIPVSLSHHGYYAAYSFHLK